MGTPPKNSGGSAKFPGGLKVIHRIALTTFVRVVTPRGSSTLLPPDVIDFAMSVPASRFWRETVSLLHVI